MSKLNRIYADWIFEENLFVVLDYLAVLAEAQMDQSDWTAIEYGLQGETQEVIEFEYGFYGKHKIEFKIVCEVGEGGHYDIYVFSDGSFEREVETVFSMAQMYRLARLKS